MNRDTRPKYSENELRLKIHAAKNEERERILGLIEDLLKYHRKRPAHGTDGESARTAQINVLKHLKREIVK